MNNIVVLPFAIPVLVAIFLVFFQKNIGIQRFVAGVGSLVSLGNVLFLAHKVKTEGIIVLQVGGWEAPFGISLVADMTSAIMLVAANIVVTSVIFYSFNGIGEEREKFYYYSFCFFLLTGVSGAFLTGDIFNLFVFFEVFLMSSYGLIVLGGTKVQLRESMKYIIFNVLSSAIFVATLGLLYSVMGTLNMADLAVKVREAEQVGIINTIAILLFVVFATKAALFPLYFWLPGAYSSPPTPVAALFGGLLTKVGIYSIIRVFTIIFGANIGFTHELFLWVAGFTMILGVLGAVGSMDAKKILAYTIITGVAFMIMGLGIYTQVSLAGVIYYMFHDMVIKAALFLLVGAMVGVAGTSNLAKMGGLIKNHPLMGWLFLAAAMALVGVPPLSGFVGKLLLVQGGLSAGNYWIVGISLVTSLLILFAITKIFLYGFWGEQKLSRDEEKATTKGLLMPAAFLILISVVLGMGAEFFYPYAELAAQQLIDPTDYINSVLKE